MAKAKPKSKAGRATNTAIKSPTARRRPAVRIYTLKVFLAETPYGRSKKFKYKKWSPQIYRTIQIRGDQTLLHLHLAIFAAFDRFDEHLWEFVIGVSPYDEAGIHYQFAPFGIEDFTKGFWHELPKVVDEYGVTIDDLKLEPKQVFAYHFDYGDDWWHRIDVVSIDKSPPAGKYPRITERVGESPPQYPQGDPGDGG